MAVRTPDEGPSHGTASIETWLQTDGHRTFAIAYLLTGDETLATGALQESLRSAESGSEVHEATIRAALRQAQKLPLDRFFLRALAHPPAADDLAALRRELADRLPEPERAALILHAVGGLSAPQIAALQRSTVPAVEGGLKRALERLGQFGDASSVWENLGSALLVQVPPFPRGQLKAVARTEVAETGARLVPARRQPLLIALGVAVVAVLSWGLLRLTVTEAASTTLPPPLSESETVTPAEVPPPAPVDLVATRIDLGLPVFPWTELAGLDPGAVEWIGPPFPGTEPISDQMRVMAEKLLQWLSEADVLGPATAPPIGSDPTIGLRDDQLVAYPWLQIRFRGGKRLLLLAEPICAERLNDCAILVGGEAQTPLRVRHPDLVRYMAAIAWTREFEGEGTPAILPFSAQQATRLTVAKVKELLAPTLDADGMQIQFVEPRPRLLQYQEPSGRWSTSLAPTWIALLVPADLAKPQVLLMIDDESSTVLLRREIEPPTPPRP